MGTVVKAPFEVTGWEPAPLELGDPGPVTITHDESSAVLTLDYELP
jgi:hypothetical protein